MLLDMDCYICMDTCDGRSKIELSCGHVYHEHCLYLEFMQQVRFNQHLLCCPYCRKSLSCMFIKDFYKLLEIKNFTRRAVVVKRQPMEYEKGLCCVLRGEDVRQCRKKSTEKFQTNLHGLPFGDQEPPDIKHKHGEAPDRHIFRNLNDSIFMNDFDFMKLFMCPFHQSNISKIKFIIHPVYNVVYKITDTDETLQY